MDHLPQRFPARCARLELILGLPICGVFCVGGAFPQHCWQANSGTGVRYLEEKFLPRKARKHTKTMRPGSPECNSGLSQTTGNCQRTRPISKEQNEPGNSRRSPTCAPWKRLSLVDSEHITNSRVPPLGLSDGAATQRISFISWALSRPVLHTSPAVPFLTPRHRGSDPSRRS